MNKHDQARDLINDELHIKGDNLWMSTYIDDFEKTEKRLQELEKDIQTFLELKVFDQTYLNLFKKLSKVGVKDG